MNKAGGDGKQRLLDAARTAFASESYGQVGVAQILEGAKVQAPTLYHHFGDKEGLYLEWACSALVEAERQLSAAMEPAHGTAESLRAFAIVLSQKLTFDLRQLLRDTERLQKPESRERILACYLQAVYNPLYAIIVRAIGRGEIRSEPIGLLAETFIAGSLALGKHGWRSSESSDEGATWWTRIFLHGCAKSELPNL